MSLRFSTPLLTIALLLACAGCGDRTPSIQLTASTPTNGAVLDRELRDFHLIFDRLPDAAAAHIEVVDVASNRVAGEINGLHTMGMNDLMAAVSGDFPNGSYELRWTLGDEANSQGAVAFTVERPDDAVQDIWEPPLDIGVVLFDGAEPLDVFGPVGIWMNAGGDNVRIHLIAEQPGPIALTTTSYPASLAPTVTAQYSFDTAPDLDVVMVPGGIGTLSEVDNDALIDFVRLASKRATLTTSVCTGSAILAKAGVLDGQPATGNKAFFSWITAHGDAQWIEAARWTESPTVYTSSGVSAGMDMSLAVIDRFFGTVHARMIAAAVEYPWQEDASNDPFAIYLDSATPYVDGLRQRFETEHKDAATHN